MVVALLIIPISVFSEVKSAQAAYSAGNLISDAEFINSTVLDAAGVQSFLNTKGGTRLRTFSENGRSAAQIIADAARSNGISPYVILATIQKEESLVESNYNFDFRVNWAMGYGVCDSCSLDDPDVARRHGFTNQVKSATEQLKWNYDYWAVNSNNPYHVGNTELIDGQRVTFVNRATSALYRYTPHLHGNLNFYIIYNRYKAFYYAAKAGKTKAIVDKGASAASKLKLAAQKGKTTKSLSNESLGAQYVSQGGATTLRPNQKITIYAYLKNTGTMTWVNTGANPFYLGNSSPQDRGSVFTGGQNQRWHMLSRSVAPGQVGVFSIHVTAPAQGGSYSEKFRPLQEGVTWFGDEVTFNFNVGGAPAASKIK